jgi:hypothetical protein
MKAKANYTIQNPKEPLDNPTSNDPFNAMAPGIGG